jgi:hypothetical protein
VTPEFTGYIPANLFEPMVAPVTRVERGGSQTMSSGYRIDPLRRCGLPVERPQGSRNSPYERPRNPPSAPWNQGYSIEGTQQTSPSRVRPNFPEPPDYQVHSGSLPNQLEGYVGNFQPYSGVAMPTEPEVHAMIPRLPVPVAIVLTQSQ